MNATERGLLDAVLESPNDDVPRLILADWHGENGQEARAEFIRVQVELALFADSRCLSPREIKKAATEFRGNPLLVDDSLPCGDCRWCLLRLRERELLQATHPGEWSRFPEELHRMWCNYRRGFVETIRPTAEQWLRHADELTRLAPIREVMLTTLPIRRNAGELVSVGILVTQAREMPTARTWNGVEYHTHYDAYFHGRDGIKASGEFSPDPHGLTMKLLEANWPRIKFTLPSILLRSYRLLRNDASDAMASAISQWPKRSPLISGEDESR